MSTETFQAPESVSGLQRLGTITAIVGVVLAGVGFALSGLDRFLQAYLAAYTFWLGVALGSMALLMVQHLSGGAWGVVIRRPLEAATSTLPAMAVLFLPIAFGMHSLYEWTHEGALNDPIIAAKAPYLNTGFFLLRAAFYFAIWIGIGQMLLKWSREQDQTGDPINADRLGYPKAFTIYDQADAVRLTGYVIRDMGLDPKRFPPRTVHATISAAKNDGLSVGEVHWVWVRRGGTHDGHEIMTQGGGKYAKYYEGGGSFERVLTGPFGEVVANSFVPPAAAFATRQTSAS